MYGKRKTKERNVMMTGIVLGQQNFFYSPTGSKFVAGCTVANLCPGKNKNGRNNVGTFFVCFKICQKKLREKTATTTKIKSPCKATTTYVKRT